MKRSIYTIVFLLLGMSLSAQSVWDGKREAIRKGSGTETDPYLIENAQQFAWLAYLINYDYSQWTKDKYFLLTTDIDLNGSEDNQWLPIGSGGGVYAGGGVYDKSMKGVLNGDGHKITGLYIDNNSPISNDKSIWYPYTSAALFSQLDKDAIIKNLYVEGFVNVDNKNCAGIAGWSGNLIRCIANVDVETNEFGGGLVAQKPEHIEECANYGDIKADKFSGGITSFSSCTIINCYNMGNIYGKEYAGGITSGNVKGSIKNCYNVGNVYCSEESGQTGAIVGKCEGSGYMVDNNYYLNTCIEEPNEYGEALDINVMRSPEFISMLNKDTNVWIYDSENTNNGFPIFTGMVTFLDINSLNNENEEFILFPNPATDYINIKGDVCYYEIFDTNGKCISKMNKIDIEQKQIDVSQYNPGIYLIRCLTNDGNSITKIFVVK
ncbi:MAG: T9SS type A sorting domain-containing protein [Bacteroidales bacterium]|nr:T9SS type A sorting domain-containing protein [Bacteroidales bacterium]